MNEEELQIVTIVPDMKIIRQYRWESDKAFRKFIKEVGNDCHSYFEDLPNSDGGASVLRPKFYPIKLQEEEK